MALFVPAGFVAQGLMPWLAGAISGLFVALMKFFSSYVFKKFAIILAVIAIIAGLTTAFFLAFEGIIYSLSLIVPPYVDQAAAWFLPPNFTTLMSVLFSARVLRWAYEWHVKVVQWKLY